MVPFPNLESDRHFVSLPLYGGCVPRLTLCGLQNIGTKGLFWGLNVLQYHWKELNVHKQRLPEVVVNFTGIFFIFRFLEWF